MMNRSVTDTQFKRQNRRQQATLPSYIYLLKHWFQVVALATFYRNTKSCMFYIPSPSTQPCFFANAKFDRLATVCSSKYWITFKSSIRHFKVLKLDFRCCNIPFESLALQDCSLTEQQRYDVALMSCVASLRADRRTDRMRDRQIPYASIGGFYSLEHPSTSCQTGSQVYMLVSFSLYVTAGPPCPTNALPAPWEEEGGGGKRDSRLEHFSGVPSFIIWSARSYWTTNQKCAREKTTKHRCEVRIPTSSRKSPILGQSWQLRLAHLFSFVLVFHCRLCLWDSSKFWHDFSTKRPSWLRAGFIEHHSVLAMNVTGWVAAST